MVDFDPGPSPALAQLLGDLPDYTPIKENFWFDWGPVFYRGRLDGSARLLCIASDPGPTERIAGRALVGDAGQRVQGFLKKVGLTRSYVCLNAFAYALFPGRLSQGKKLVKRPELIAWRNQVFDQVVGPDLQAVVAFGTLAHDAVAAWPGREGVPVFNTFHPSYRASEKKLLDDWRQLVTQLQAIVTPDADAPPDVPNYGPKFTEADYAPIPKRDLPFGLPPWFGDESWRRLGKPRSNNSVKRPVPDDRHTLIWTAPTT